MTKKEEIPLTKEVEVHNICGHFSEKDIIWNIIRLKPGHDIIISTVDNNEYTLDEKSNTVYADVCRSHTYFWRPLSDYDGLNPIPDRNKSISKITLKGKKND